MARSDRRRFRPGNQTARLYAVWIGTFLFCYSFLVYGVAVVAPYVLPAMKLVSSAPLAEREHAAAQFLLLGEVFWPVFTTLLVGAVVFSVFLAHRIAGPLFRLEGFATELAHGNLAARIRLRKGDQLLTVAELMNRGTVNIDTSLREAREYLLHARDELGGALDELAAQADPGGSQGVIDRLESAIKATDGIHDIVDRLCPVGSAEEQRST